MPFSNRLSIFQIGDVETAVRVDAIELMQSVREFRVVGKQFADLHRLTVLSNDHLVDEIGAQSPGSP